MSEGNDLTFDDIIHILLNDGDAANRAEAARVLGEYVGALSNAEYGVAVDALNQALTDSNPLVIGAAMSAMTRYQRNVPPRLTGDEFEIHGDPQGMIAPSACAVCGRPEALVPDGGCERGDCPYR